jgi:hypothetical protein
MSFKAKFREFKESLKSVRFFWKTIWNHRWYDYAYFQDLLDKQLEYLEANYGENSHYVGDCFTKGRIRILRKYLEDWKDCDMYEIDPKYCKEKRDKFFKHLSLNIDKFWD